MPQDRDSGERAMRFGHSMAKRVADYLGAKLIEPSRSNKAIWNNRKINIKSAKLGNSKIGVTLNILDWADSIIAAIQEDATYFTLYEVTSKWFRGEMRPSRQPHVMMVSNVKISKAGTNIGPIKV
jgi:hypothetical protein